MRELSEFVKNEFAKKQLFEEYQFIESIEGVDEIISSLNCGIYTSIKFKNSGLKDYFIDKITTCRPETNIINCNCSIDRFFENSFDGLIIFNNIGKCRYQEILNEMTNYKSIKIC
jgi:hypothetical protein